MAGRKMDLRIVHLMIAVLLAAVAVGFAFHMSVSSYAAEDDKAIQIVEDCVGENIKGKQNSNIYFGNYKQSSDGNGGFKVEPIKWRVLQNADSRLFLLSDKSIDAYIQVDETGGEAGGTWEQFSLRTWLNNDLLESAFTLSEQESIAVTHVVTGNNPKYDTPSGNPVDDKMFILSYEEATNEAFGFNSDYEAKDAARKCSNTDYTVARGHHFLGDPDERWWLRTSGQFTSTLSVVRVEGDIGLSGIGAIAYVAKTARRWPIRPAMKIDLNSVLFTSAPVDGKVSGKAGPDAMRAVEEYSGKEWKLTVKDADRKFKVAETKAACHANEKVTLHYTDAEVFDVDTAPNEYISAILTDKSGEVLYYGRIDQPLTADGTVDITIPKTLVKGTYNLKVLNEQYNGDKKTDYASEMSTVKLTVDDPLVPYVNDAGRKQEPKVCTPVTVNDTALSSGWYALLEDAVILVPITISGDVNLIVCDGAKLSASGGIMINSNSSLTIWAQSMGKNAGEVGATLGVAGTGKAGIGFEEAGAIGKLVINGSRITATGNTGGAGIGGGFTKAGGNVDIRGGKVTAMGSTVISDSEAIGRGSNSSGSSGDLKLGRVKVSTDGGKSYVAGSKRISTCRSKIDEVLIERCSNHMFENNVCKYCGAGTPKRIDDDNADLQVTYSKDLTFNGEEQTQVVEKITLDGVDITEFCDISDNRQKDAGDHELTITADKECGYEGTIKKKFTIKKIVPSFTVSAVEVNDDLSVSAAGLTRSDTTIPGTLELDETTLSYGTNTYNWTFTPEDTKNYETVNGTVSITVAGHSWEFVGFEWTGNEKDGYTAAVAKYVCKKNADHKETVIKVTLTDIVTKPTCTEGGKIVYTAAVSETDSIDGEKHTESKDAKATVKLGHSWKEATCTEPKTCSVCHTTEGEPAGHSWGAWTKVNEEQHMRVCENDSTHTETEPHKWDDGVITKESTTTETGEKLFTCSVCKATRTETIPVLMPDDPKPDGPKPDEKEAEEAKEDKTLPVVDIDKTDTVGNFKKKQMKIVFPADKKVDNYRIQYRLAGKKIWTSDWSAGTGTYVVKNLKKYSLCEFRIAGYVQMDDGTWIRSRWSRTSYRYMSSAPLKTVRAGKKSIKVTWTKEGKSDGYRIQYSLKKNMTGKKTIIVKGKSKTKYTIKGLKKGKAYYVRIRPIKNNSGKTYIGILSGTKKAKVK